MTRCDQKISAHKVHTMPIKKMKRKIQHGLASDAAVAAMSSHAFVLSTQGRLNGTSFEFTNLGGTLGLNQKFCFDTGDSISFGSDASASTLVGGGFLAYDFYGIPGIQMDDLPGFLNQTVFTVSAILNQWPLSHPPHTGGNL